VLEYLVQIRLPSEPRENMHKHKGFDMQSGVLLGQSDGSILAVAFVGASIGLQDEGRDVRFKKNNCWISLRGICSSTLQVGEGRPYLGLSGGTSLLHEEGFWGVCRRQ
jgi:hypothetical protein